MSINDIYNINNFNYARVNLQVNGPNTQKKLTQEQNLFDSAPNNNNPSFLLFPGSNEYDDEDLTKQKNKNNFFL